MDIQWSQDGIQVTSDYVSSILDDMSDEHLAEIIDALQEETWPQFLQHDWFASLMAASTALCIGTYAAKRQASKK